MTQATGIFKQVAIKREVTYGTIPTATAAQLLRRVQSTIDLSKDTYASNEIRPDMQIADFRHGVRRIKGVLSGELSPKTYSDQLSAMLKRDFAAGVSTSAASITIAGSAGAWTITRAAGSYLTDGFKIGDVIRLSVGGFNASNLNKNVLVTALTATVATGMVLNASLLVAEGPITGATVAVQGKKTWIPATSQTDVSYSMEHWYNDITQSEVLSGVKFDKATISLPPTGMATVSFDLIGQQYTPSQVRYFTSPTAITSTGVVASANGILIVNGVAQAVVTGLTLTLDPTFSGDPVVGFNTVPNQFAGPVAVTGQFTAYFTDNVLRDLFVNETESSLIVALTTDNTATADVLCFTLPRIKLGGQQKTDGTGGIVQTFPFQALINVNGGTGTATEQTTILIQDTAA
jgi:translation initiation factor 1 (eIF-1/SUI1)